MSELPLGVWLRTLQLPAVCANLLHMEYPITTDPIVPEMLRKFREQAMVAETGHLIPKAAFSKDHLRFNGPEEDHRLPYKRDVDRIVHSKAYSRYTDKTQVVYLVANDHVTNRGIHVQLVSNFAKGIAEILGLNVDLVEAISLGHDVGHPPFGHEGEGYLSQLSVEFVDHAFAHPWQSCRLFSEIEPLNLGFAVYDGFLCHDGGMRERTHYPFFGKTWDDHFADRKQKLLDPEGSITPATLEGCLVKLCDTVSYVGRDIEDAISLNIISRDQVPETLLGKTNRELLKVVAADIIEESFGKDYISMSQQVFDAIKTLRDFNFDNIYRYPALKVESSKIQKSYRILFLTLLDDHRSNPKNSYLWKNFLHNKPASYIKDTSIEQTVIDFIAGMTDNYFVRTLEALIVPRPINLR